MATPGQEFSRHQQGIVSRYYEHIDTIALQKLGEIVSDLYMAEGGSKATKLWNNARTALAKLAPADDPHVTKVLSVRSVAGLAKLVTEMQNNSRNAGKNAPPASAREPVVGETPLVPITSAGGATPNAREVRAAAATTQTSEVEITPDLLKQAMKAFRKRLKLTRLDEESKLGRVGNPMSGGKKSQIMAIMPPREYPQAAWEELVKQGKLKSGGGSFYELAEGQ